MEQNIPASSFEEVLPLAHGRGPQWLRLKCWAQFLILIVLAFVFVIVDHSPLWHTDIWGHLKFGQWITNHGALPQSEPFVDWVRPAQPYDGHSWLSQRILYQVYHFGELLAGSGAAEVRAAGGVELLRLLHALLFALHLAILTLAYQRLADNWWLALAFLLITVALSFTHVAVLRPQVFGEVCFAILLLTLARPAPSLFAMFGVPAMFAVWANLHGSFLVGLIVLLGFAGGRMLFLFATYGVQVRPYWKDARCHGLLRMVWTSALLIGIFNPAGFRLYGEVFRFGSHPNIAFMDEWKPIGWDSPWGAVYFATLVLILMTHLTGLVVPPAQDRPDRRFGVIPLGQLILLACFGVQTYFKQRLMIWWIMLVPWICIGPWAHFVRGLKKAEPATPQATHVGLAPIPTMILLLAWVLLPLLLSGPAEWCREGRPPELDRIVHPGTPLMLVRQLDGQLTKPLPLLSDWLNQHAQNGFPGHVFSSETQGDFLLWALPSELAPVIYTHVHLFTPDHWQKVLRVKFAHDGWRRTLDAWKINLLIFEAEIHADLRRNIHADPATWQVVLDEFADARKKDPRARLFIAVRTVPLR